MAGAAADDAGAPVHVARTSHRRWRDRELYEAGDWADESHFATTTVPGRVPEEIRRFITEVGNATVRP